MQPSPDLDVEAQALGEFRNSRRRKRRRPSSKSWRDRVINKEKDTGPPKYGDTSATYWKMYKSEAETDDKNLIQSIMGNTSSMVLLNSLFSSIVASFIIEIYKTLIPGNSTSPNTPPNTAVRINIVLFLSFFLSIVSAVSCALIQQWCNEYLKYAYPRTAPHDSGRVRTYLFYGLNQFQMTRFLYGTHVLLHISVFLFFWAISEFFYTIHHSFGIVIRYALVTSMILYILLSISSLIYGNSPYNTPMTPPIRAAFMILRIAIRFFLWCLRRDRSRHFEPTGLPYYKGIHFNKAHFYSIEAEMEAEMLEPYAMEWLFTDDDFSDSDMDKFLEGLPGYMSSDHTIKGQLGRYLTADYILSRIKAHFMACATSVELSDEAVIARVSSCANALRHIFQYSHECKEKSSAPDKLKILKEESQLQRTYIQGLMDDLQVLCSMDIPTIALRASCIRALLVQGPLFQLVSPDGGTSTDEPPFPASLLPIYKFFFLNDDTNTIQLDDGHTPSAMEANQMRKTLLHEGPLANLTKLAQAVRDTEHAPPPILSFCWKALDILLTQLGSIQSGESTGAYSDFDKLHKNIRTYVHKERGFRVAPLLDILDNVARGRRLLMVFSGNPKYQDRADLVFGKEHLRNSDLLEAFAHSLPDFISNNSSEVCKGFMEKVVRHDDLWTSLQVNLWNTQRSDRPISDKVHVFEDCCTVLDLAFSVLEDSQEVDWRAPEFGSLAQHFESFITHCFQGVFMGRATSFRVGIAKARFCKALLTQFSNDVELEGTVSFRSQWDVASLARLIYTLGLRDEEDPEFWNSYVDGGHIGAEFRVKALEMIDRTARDGPLLIFCQIGQLVATAVPLDQSGLERKDIENVLELQRKVIEKKRLPRPLNRASDTVWKALGQLREQVNEVCGKSKAKDVEILQRLLLTIDDVFRLRFSGSESSSQSDTAEEQGSKTSSSGESRGIGNRFSFAYESTAVTGRTSSGTQISEAGLESGSRGVPSPNPTAQGTAGVGIMGRSSAFPSTTLPVVPHMPYIRDARQRRTHKSTRRTGSGFSFTRPLANLVTRASTGALFTSRRHVPTVPPNPAISSPYGSFGLNDEGQTGSSPTLRSGPSSPPSHP